MPLSPSAHHDHFCRDNLPAESTWPQFVGELPRPDRLNCATALLDGAVQRFGGDRPCVLSAGETLTYAQLLARANQVAHVLVDDHGLVPGQRVLLRGPNNPWLVACWFGVVKAGGVVVTTMPMLRSGELAKLVAITQPAIALCDSRFLEELQALDELQAVDTAPPIVAFGGDGDDDLAVTSRTRPETFDDVETAPDDVVMLAPTSGTTGTPKATMHFHRDVLAIADTFSALVVQPTSDDVFTGTPPLAFTFGLGGLLVFPMRVGAATLLLEKATPGELADAIEQYGVTVLYTAPTAYRAILRERKENQLRSLRRCVSAGEHLPVTVWEDFAARTGLRIINGLGSTELLHVFISSADDDIRPGSTGRVVPGYLAEIQDDDGRAVPDGTPGRLAVKGPTGCRYLAGDRQLDYVRNGWNLTGDTFIRDEDGYYWYQARSDDMIVSSGYNIGAPEVEMVIDQHPDVVASAVVGLPDEERGMIVHAFVVLADGLVGDQAKIVDIQNFVKQHAAPYKYPRSIEFIDALPRTDSGKLQRYRLRAVARRS